MTAALSAAAVALILDLRQRSLRFGPQPVAGALLALAILVCGTAVFGPWWAPARTLTAGAPAAPSTTIKTDQTDGVGGGGPPVVPTDEGQSDNEPGEFSFTSDVALDLSAELERAEPEDQIIAWQEAAADNPEDFDVAMGLSFALTGAGDRPGALDATEALMRRWPEEARAYALLADALVAIGNLDETNRVDPDRDTAEAILEQGLRVQPDQPDLMRRLGYLYTGLLDQNDRGFAILEHAANLYPTDVKVLYSYAYWGLDEVGRREEGPPVLRRAVGLDPTYTALWNGLIYFAQDNDEVLSIVEEALPAVDSKLGFVDRAAGALKELTEEEADSVVDGMLSRHPEDPAFLLISAYNQRDRGNMEGAELEWLAAMRKGGWTAEPDFMMRHAALFEAAGHVDDALNVLTDLAEIEPTTALIATVDTLRRSGEHTEALDTATSTDMSTNTGPFVAMWLALGGVTDLAAAQRLDACNRALEVEPGIQSYQCRARAYAAGTQHEEALADYRTAVGYLYPALGGHDDLFDEAEVSARALGLDTAVHDLLRSALERSPNSRVRRLRLADALVEFGDRNSAIDVLRVPPHDGEWEVDTDPWLPHYRARLLSELGRDEEAIADFQLAAVLYQDQLDKHPENFRWRAGLAEALVKAGDPAASIREFTVLLEDDDPSITVDDRIYWYSWRAIAKFDNGDEAGAAADRELAAQLTSTPPSTT